MPNDELQTFRWSPNGRPARTGFHNTGWRFLPFAHWISNSYELKNTRTAGQLLDEFRTFGATNNYAGRYAEELPVGQFLPLVQNHPDSDLQAQLDNAGVYTPDSNVFLNHEQYGVTVELERRRTADNTARYGGAITWGTIAAGAGVTCFLVSNPIGWTCALGIGIGAGVTAIGSLFNWW